jgi:flagellin-specific chaperone FliS
MHIVTYKLITVQYHVRKREIIRDLRLILETEAPNITGSRLGAAYAWHQQHLHKTSDHLPPSEQHI